MTITKEKNGSWTLKARIKCADDEFHPMTIRGYSKKKDAQDDYENQEKIFIEKWNVKLGKQKVEKMKGNTFGEVIDEFLFNYKLKNRPGSYIRLETQFNLRFISYFPCKTKTDEVFKEDKIMAWKMWLIKQKVCAKTINEDINIMKRLIDRTIRRNKVVDKESANACYLALDTIKDDQRKTKNVDFWTIDEYKQFISAFPSDDKYRLIFECFFYTGLRCGELLGLQWKHFNEKDHTLKVEQQLNNKLRTGKPEIVPPKTANAYRTIDLNKTFYDELIEHKQEIYRGNDDDFIFFGKSPSSSTTIRRYLDFYSGKAKVKRIRIHDLRHTHASLMIYLGADVKYLMHRLGHATYEETMSTYGHLYPNVAKNIISKLDNILM